RVEDQVCHRLGERGGPAVDRLHCPHVESEMERPAVVSDLLLPPGPGHRHRVLDDLIDVDRDELLLRAEARKRLDAPHRLGAVAADTSNWCIACPVVSRRLASAYSPAGRTSVMGRPRASVDASPKVRSAAGFQPSM